MASHPPHESETGPKGVIVAARHGERLDYVLRDSGSNWIPTAERPWDPPLSDAALKEQQQESPSANGGGQGGQGVRELGRRVARSLRRHGLPPVTVVYSSPLLRCCQTAAGAIAGLEEEEDDSESRPTAAAKSSRRSPLQIRIEHGLVESLCEKWYRSWCLPGSDGTWGYCPPAPAPDEAMNGGGAEGGKTGSAPSPSRWSVDDCTLHPMAKVPVQTLFLAPEEMEERLRATCGAVRSDDSSTEAGGQASMVDVTYATSLHPIAAPYRWSDFESRRTQLSRVDALSRKLAERHPGETVLLVSHGSPVTHLFEVLTGKHWTEHGVCGYGSFSVYEHHRRQKAVAGGAEDGSSGDFSWREVVVNDSTHVLDESSAEYKSGR